MAINEWSTTAGNNGSGVTGVNWAEGQAPSTVNDSARAMMADVATWYGQASGKIPEYLTSISGTNTITAAGPAAMSAYAAGQRFMFIPAATNTGATTINITPSGGSALGAKNIFNGGVACAGGEITINVPVIIIYDGTQFNVIGPATAHTGSGLVLIGSIQTASSSSTIDFTSASYPAAFDGSLGEVTFHWEGVRPGTDAVTFQALAGTGAGPTWHNSANDYEDAGNVTDNSGANAPFGSGTPANVRFTGPGQLGNTTTKACNGTAKLSPSPANTAFHKSLRWDLYYVSSAGSVVNVNGSSRYAATTAWTGVRFQMGAGNIAEGKFWVTGNKLS